MSKSKFNIVPAGMEDNYDENDDPVMKTFENMKITIVPDITINAGINNENFDSTLSDDLKLWFDSYCKKWNIYKTTPAMIETLRLLYLNADNPLLLALKLFANCPGCNHVKNKSLPFLILETISNIKNEKPEIISKCDKNTKMVAFNFVKTQGLPNLYTIVVNAYELDKDKDLFEDKIKYMISQNNYKDATKWAVLLGLTDKFGIFDLIFPLILQDKISLAEEYLSCEVSLQRPVIELLDSLLDKPSLVSSNCDNYIIKYNYTDVRYEKIQWKPLTKLIARLVKKYELPPETIPNVTRSKTYGYLQYLIYKKYVEKSMNNDSWRELINDNLPYIVNSKDIQLEFITSISYNDDIDEAIYWSEFFNLSIDELPLLVREYIKKSKNQSDCKINDNDVTATIEQHENNSTKSNYDEQKKNNQEMNVEEMWDDTDYKISKKDCHTNQNCVENQLQQNQNQSVYNKSSPQQQQQQRNHSRSQQQQQKLSSAHDKNHHKDKFYELKLDMKHVKLIETKEDFEMMLCELKNETLISFDTEWKPSFQFQFSVSLIQIAKFDKVFLIDAQSEFITDELWSKLGKYIFNNLEIIKIGFALSQDLLIIQKVLPAANVSTNVQSCYVDLQELWKKLVKLHDFHFPYKSTTSNETLSHLVEICLGKKLDKSNQFSNWGKRPLRKDQIIYAALDAYCLLEVYKVISEQLNRIGIDLEQIIDDLNSELVRTKLHKNRKKPKNKNQFKNENENENGIQQEGPNSQSIKVADVQFVCDNMLAGLAKALRKYGINCVTVSGDQKDECIKIALKENRYLLTRGFRSAKFSQYLPKGYCYNVQNDQINDQIIEVIQYFNVIITENDVLSRCQMCNCNEFILATGDHLNLMKNNKNVLYDEEINKKKYNKKMQIPPKRNCIMNKITMESLKAKKTAKEIPIQVDNVSQIVIENTELFYICEGCGKCYWDGSHWEKVINGNLKHIITK